MKWYKKKSQRKLDYHLNGKNQLFISERMRRYKSSLLKGQDIVLPTDFIPTKWEYQIEG